MNQLTCNLGSGKFDLKKFSKRIYVQMRYLRALGIQKPVFIFTLPPEQRDEVENAIIDYWISNFKARITVEARNPTSTILGVEFPAVRQMHLHWPQTTIALMDQSAWDKFDEDNEPIRMPNSND